jgi:hypothetical protein
MTRGNQREIDRQRNENRLKKKGLDKKKDDDQTKLTVKKER